MTLVRIDSIVTSSRMVLKVSMQQSLTVTVDGNFQSMPCDKCISTLKKVSRMPRVTKTLSMQSVMLTRESKMIGCILPDKGLAKDIPAWLTLVHAHWWLSSMIISFM